MMKTNTVDPARTFALVIGIEQYALGSGPGIDLDGPAHDARTFADWLVRQGVPQDNIVLLLSPLDHNRHLFEEWSGSWKWEATRARVDDAVYNWLQPKVGDLLWVFWGGHGVITAKRERRLFYADTNPRNQYNLDWESLRIHLASNSLTGFQQQICIVDTCANYRREFSPEQLGYGQRFPSGQPVSSREQFTFFATREGERAKNLNREQTGLFSKIMLEELTKEPATPWPPYLERIAERLKERFAVLKEDKTAQQTPIFAEYQNWEGTIRELVHVVEQPASGSWLPPPPQHAIDRQDELDLVKKDLLERVNEPITGGRRIALVGMGGAGKTVLAAQLARDQDIQRSFPGGVYWLSLDEKTRLDRHQARLVSVLGGTEQDFTDWVEGQNRLSKLLTGRICLLVLDNVWQSTQLDAFDVLGPRGRLLFTTRDAGLAEGYAASVHSIGLLSVEQARELLANWSGLDTKALPPEASGVLERCGGLPLAVAMAGAMVRSHPERWPSLLQKLTGAGIGRIAARLPGYPHPNLLVAVDVSVENLDTAGQEKGLRAALDRYVDLAVFKGLGAVPESALSALWANVGVDETMIGDYVALFVDQSLANRDVEGCLLLHDLQMEDVTSRARGQLQTLHNRLVDGYAQRKTLGWASVPDDGYFFQHLPQHLCIAGRIDELRMLLLDAAWIRAKLSATGVSSLVADYALVAGDASLQLIGEALRLSARALAHDANLLEGQLLGRLADRNDPTVKSLLDEVARSRIGTWLRPLTRSLSQPNGLLSRVLRLPLDNMGGIQNDDSLQGVAISSDGRIVLCTAYRSDPQDPDKIHTSLLVWDLWSLEEPRELRPSYPLGVKHFAITGDGRLAAFAFGPWDVVIVDLLSGNIAKQTTTTRLNPTSIAIADDPMRVVVGHLDGWVACWEPNSGKVQTARVFKNHVRALAISAGGTMVVAMSNYGELVRLPLPDMQPVQHIGYHDGAFDLALSPDDRCVVTGGHDRSLVLWDIEHGQPDQPAQVLPPQDSRISDISFTDRKQAITVLEDGTIQVWDLAKAQILASAELDTWITQLAVSRAGHTAIARQINERAVALDLTALNDLASMAGQGRPTAVAVTPDGRVAFSGSTRGVLTRFDVPSKLASSGVRSRVVATCTYEGGHLSISGDWSGIVKVFDIRSQPPNEWSGPLWEQGIARLGVTPNGRRVVWGTTERYIIVWEGADHSPYSVTWGGGLPIVSIVATSTGLVIAAQQGGEISYGDAERNVWGQWEAPLYPYYEPEGILCATVPNAQSRLLGTRDGSLILEERGGRKLRVVAHKAPVEAVVVTPDGAVVVSGARDGTVALWLPHLSVPPQAVPGHASPVSIVAVASDGTFAVSGSNADDLTLWALPELTAVANFQCDGRIEDVALAAGASLVVVADGSGYVHLLVPVSGPEAV